MGLVLKERLRTEAPCKQLHKGAAQLTSRARPWSPSFLSQRVSGFEESQSSLLACACLCLKGSGVGLQEGLCACHLHIWKASGYLSYPSYDPNGILYLFSPYLNSNLFTKFLTHCLCVHWLATAPLNAFVARMNPKGVADYRLWHQIARSSILFFSLITVWPSPSHFTSLGLNTYKNVMKIK